MNEHVLVSVCLVKKKKKANQSTLVKQTWALMPTTWKDCILLFCLVLCAVIFLGEGVYRALLSWFTNIWPPFVPR